MTGDFFKKMQSIFLEDQTVGALKGYDKTCELIRANAKFGVLHIDRSTISATAIDKLRDEGFCITPSTRGVYDQRDSYDVDIWIIQWK